jgi:hypothetical protein
MAQHNSQQNDNAYASLLVWNTLTPPLTASQINSQQQQQMPIHANNNNNIEVISSQPMSLMSSSLSSTSSLSIGSTSSQVRTEDQLFDKIEDMMCEYMREPTRHYLHCRVLRWYLENDVSHQFSAVVVINPPTSRN